MSENESKLQKEISRYQDSVYDSSVDIEKATMALRELLNEYEWAYEPDARKAIEHSSTIGGSEDKVAQFSYKYIPRTHRGAPEDNPQPEVSHQEPHQVGLLDME